MPLYMPPLLKITTVTGRLKRHAVEKSIPENPKAESPSMATTLLPVATAAPTIEPIPMPMMAHVAQSTRWRGNDMLMASRVSSRVLAPSLTSITSGLASRIGLITPRAVQWCIGISDFASSRRAANLASLALVSAWREGTHCGSADIFLPSMAARSASRDRPMSPTTGAAIGRLTSISCGSTSSWINLVSGLHLPLPNDSIQLSLAPTTMPTSASFIMVERHDSALSGPASGITPLAIDMGR